ncbi:MAG: hypothetical protein ACP5P4_03120 [Steroidobacteraceae bacterium]
MRLRAALLAFSGLAVVVGALELLAVKSGHGLALLVLGAVGLLATVFERWRYRKPVPPAARWQATGERFEDPATGEPLEVLYDPVTGERRYAPLEHRSP